MKSGFLRWKEFWNDFNYFEIRNNLDAFLCEFEIGAAFSLGIAYFKAIHNLYSECRGYKLQSKASISLKIIYSALFSFTQQKHQLNDVIY